MERWLSGLLPVFAAILLLGLVPPGTAAVRDVGTGHTYSTIMQGINAAEDGDTVLVYPGTYVVYPEAGAATDRINFLGKKITVCSTNPNSAAVVASTIIELAESGPYQTCISIVLFNNNEGRSSILRGFTIRKGRDPYYGAGVRISNGCSPTIERCVFTNNHSDGPGGAIDSGNGAPLIRYNTFDGNSGVKGGAIRAMGRAVIRENTFKNNSATWGGAVYCGAEVQVLSNTFTGNWGSSGGAICCGGPAALIQSNIFADNDAPSTGSGGAIGLFNDTQVQSNVFRHNSAGHGGALAVFQGAPMIVNNLIYNNSARYSGGGFATVNSVALPTVVNCTFYGNSCPNDYEAHGGGNVRGAQGTTLRNCIIACAPQGGGVWRSKFDAAPTLQYCDVWGNQPTDFLEMNDPTGSDGNLKLNPLFANAAAGGFRLKSEYGRYVAATKSWVNDTVTSPCINAGDPSSNYSQEPAPNGGRINMGYDGNTAAASKAPYSPPQLLWAGETGYSADGVQPDASTKSVPFTFKVKYRQSDNQAPVYVRLYLFRPDGKQCSGSPFAMTGAGATWSAGVIFSKTISLGLHGNYAYYFTAQLGTVTARLPVSPSERCTGPLINRPPTLAWAGQPNYVGTGVTPHTGTSATTFTFRVKITDLDGEAPDIAVVRVWKATQSESDGWWAWLEPETATPDYAAGVIYRAQLQVGGDGAGTHCYYFFTRDPFGATVRLPANTHRSDLTVTDSGSTSLVVSAVSAQQVGEAVSLAYTLSAAAQVQATVLNLAGRTIAVIPGGKQEEGVQTLHWSGRNAAGSLVPAGVYLVRIEARSEEGATAQAVTTVNLRR